MSIKHIKHILKTAQKKDLNYVNPQTVHKSPKLMHINTSFSHASRTVVTFKSNPNCLKACLIRRTTSGKPTIGLKTHQLTNMGQSAAILYIILLSWPCMQGGDRTERNWTHKIINLDLSFCQAQVQVQVGWRSGEGQEGQSQVWVMWT